MKTFYILPDLDLPAVICRARDEASAYKKILEKLFQFGYGDRGTDLVFSVIEMDEDVVLLGDE